MARGLNAPNFIFSWSTQRTSVMVDLQALGVLIVVKNYVINRAGTAWYNAKKIQNLLLANLNNNHIHFTAPRGFWIIASLTARPPRGPNTPAQRHLECAN